MERFTKAILKSVADENWYGALFVSLAVPDICASLSSVNNKSNGKKYAAWFDKYLSGSYTRVRPSGERAVFMDGDACYALRCSMLHQGEADITSQRVKSILDSFHFTTTSGHCNKINSVLQIDVATFCKDVCKAVMEWNEEFKQSKDYASKIDKLLTVHTSNSTILGGMVAFMGPV